MRSSRGLCLDHHAALFFFFFLQSILLALTFSAPKAFCCKTLVTKSRPRTKVFAALAPLDFKPARDDNPNVDVAQSAETLVLSWNDGVTTALVSHEVLPVAAPGGKSVVRTTLDVRVLLCLVAVRAWAATATHDAAAHAFGKVARLFLRHVCRKVDQAGKLGDWRFGRLVNVTLELGGNRRLQGYALSLGHCHVVQRRCHVVGTPNGRWHSQIMRTPHALAQSHGRGHWQMRRHGRRNMQRHGWQVRSWWSSATEIAYPIVGMVTMLTGVSGVTIHVASGKKVHVPAILIHWASAGKTIVSVLGRSEEWSWRHIVLVPHGMHVVVGIVETLDSLVAGLTIVDKERMYVGRITVVVVMLLLLVLIPLLVLLVLLLMLVWVLLLVVVKRLLLLTHLLGRLRHVARLVHSHVILSSLACRLIHEKRKRRRGST